MKIVSSRFERATTRAADEPRAPGPDIVFAGRSNVGKSSLINLMLGTKGLARTSSRPGRTQTINFYRVNETCHFVDLPGYGWAKVPLAIREQWGPMIEGFLSRRRERIALALVVVDARHEASELDLTMRDWFEHHEIPYLVAATKSDKLASNRQKKAARALQTVVGDSSRCDHPIMVSSQSGLGLRELWRYLDSAMETCRKTP